MNFRDAKDYEAGVLVFGDNGGTDIKPNHAGQLFYAAIRKLKPNTELIIHSDNKYFNEVSIQLIKVEFADAAPGEEWQINGTNTWCMSFRQEDGTEELVDLYFIGVTAYNKTWNKGVWVTLKDDHDKQ